MKSYHLRPGVVAANICGARLLLATRAAAKECASHRPMNLLEGLCVDVLTGKLTEENRMTVFQILTKQTPEEWQEQIDAIYAKLADEGWLIPEDEA